MALGGSGVTTGRSRFGASNDEGARSATSTTSAAGGDVGLDGDGMQEVVESGASDEDGPTPRSKNMPPAPASTGDGVHKVLSRGESDVKMTAGLQRVEGFLMVTADVEQDVGGGAVVRKVIFRAKGKDGSLSITGGRPSGEAAGEGGPVRKPTKPKKKRDKSRATRQGGSTRDTPSPAMHARRLAALGAGSVVGGSSMTAGASAGTAQASASAGGGSDSSSDSEGGAGGLRSVPRVPSKRGMSTVKEETDDGSSSSSGKKGPRRAPADGGAAGGIARPGRSRFAGAAAVPSSNSRAGRVGSRAAGGTDDSDSEEEEEDSDDSDDSDDDYDGIATVDDMTGRGLSHGLGDLLGELAAVSERLEDDPTMGAFTPEEETAWGAVRRAGVGYTFRGKVPDTPADVLTRQENVLANVDSESDDEEDEDEESDGGAGGAGGGGGGAAGAAARAGTAASLTTVGTTTMAGVASAAHIDAMLSPRAGAAAVAWDATFFRGRFVCCPVGGNRALGLVYGMAESKGRRGVMEDRMVAIPNLNASMAVVDSEMDLLSGRSAALAGVPSEELVSQLAAAGKLLPGPRYAFFAVFDGHNGVLTSEALAQSLHMHLAERLHLLPEAAHSPSATSPHRPGSRVTAAPSDGTRTTSGSTNRLGAASFTKGGGGGGGSGGGGGGGGLAAVLSPKSAAIKRGRVSTDSSDDDDALDPVTAIMAEGAQAVAAHGPTTPTAVTVVSAVPTAAGGAAPAAVPAPSVPRAPAPALPRPAGAILPGQVVTDSDASDDSEDEAPRRHALPAMPAGLRVGGTAAAPASAAAAVAVGANTSSSDSSSSSSLGMGDTGGNAGAGGALQPRLSSGSMASLASPGEGGDANACSPGMLEYEVLVDTCLQMDSDIVGGMIPGEPISGSTGIMVLVKALPARGSVVPVPVLFCANVGDSRAVLSRGGRKVDLSFDHKVTRPDERARIEAAGGTIIKDRLHGVLAVSRAFGDAEHKIGLGSECWGVEFTADPLSAVPEVTHEPLTVEDEFVVLACDGVWDVMTSQQVVNFVRHHLLEHRDAGVAARALVDKAIALGSIDNVSVQVVVFQLRSAL